MSQSMEIRILRTLLNWEVFIEEGGLLVPHASSSHCTIRTERARYLYAVLEEHRGLAA